MTALSIQVPYPIFSDKDGSPLQNGYVWIGTQYLEPRTNPVTVYFDEALTQIAPQPLRTLNGYVYNAGSPAQLYVNGVNFSILVQNKNGSMVYSFPDGSGISPDSNGVSYTPSGAGAVATTVQSKLRESVSVKDFGAVGDGVTDDTAAIQAAHDALPTYGGEIVVPYGSYLFSSTLAFTKIVKVKGVGNAHSNARSPSEFLKASTLAGTGISFSGNGSCMESIGVRGVVGNTGDGILIKASRCTLRDVSVFAMGNDGIRIGTDAGGENCNLWMLDNCKTKTNGRHGVYVSEGAGALADTNAGTCVNLDTQSNVLDGLYFGGSQLNTVIGGAYQNNGQYGIHLGPFASYHYFVGGDVEANITSQVRISAGAIGNRFVNQTLQYTSYSIANTSDDNFIDGFGSQGAFTPVLRDNTAGTAATATTSIGYFTKVGKRIFFDITFTDINTTGLTAGNQVVITGLPYTASSTAGRIASVPVHVANCTSTTGNIWATIITGSTRMTLLNGTTTGLSTWPVSSITSGTGDIYISGSYEV